MSNNGSIYFDILETLTRDFNLSPVNYVDIAFKKA